MWLYKIDQKGPAHLDAWEKEGRGSCFSPPGRDGSAWEKGQAIFCPDAHNKFTPAARSLSVTVDSWASDNGKLETADTQSRMPAAGRLRREVRQGSMRRRVCRRRSGQCKQGHCSVGIVGLPNYPRESAPLSAAYCGPRDRSEPHPSLVKIYGNIGFGHRHSGGSNRS